jgi:hypothetical protein
LAASLGLSSDSRGGVGRLSPIRIARCRRETGVPGKRRQLGGIDRLPSGRYRVRVTDEATDKRVSLGSFVRRADAEQALAKAIRPDAGSIHLEEYAT